MILTYKKNICIITLICSLTFFTGCVEVNHVPVAQDDALVVQQDQPGSVNVLLNDTDVKSPVTVELLSQPNTGTATIDNDGTLTYTPSSGYLGADQVIYRVTDADGDYATAKVVIDVQVQCDTCSLTANNDQYETNEDTSLQISNYLENDQISSSSYRVSFTQPSSGVLSQDAEGAFVYQPNKDFYGADAFTYTLQDDFGKESVATIDLQVLSVNDVPIAQDDSLVVQQDQSGSVDVLLNDTDVVEFPITVELLSQPNAGTITIGNDGTLTYTPNSGFVGADEVSYRVSDANGDSATAKVVIDVQSSLLTLRWNAPMTNELGETVELSQIGGYRIYMKGDLGEMKLVAQIDDSNIMEYVLEGLASASYEMAVTAFDTDGVESEFSEMIGNKD